MDIPPRRGHNRPHRAPVDDETTSTPLATPLQVESQTSSTSLANQISQPDFFPLTTPKVCLADVNFWYAMAKIQTLTKQGQNLVSFLTVIAQLSRVGTSSSGSMCRKAMPTKKCLRCR